MSSSDYGVMGPFPTYPFFRHPERQREICFWTLRRWRKADSSTSLGMTGWIVAESLKKGTDCFVPAGIFLFPRAGAAVDRVVCPLFLFREFRIQDTRQTDKSRFLDFARNDRADRR
jgi:hypothetical protein